MKHIIIGTAGHIDHGKTALIKALTGTDTDRLKEEKQRGITIELGFTSFRLPDGTLAGIVDVPGHEKFVGNMVTGVVGMDLVLLLIAADEGIMPQTREHISILQELGVQNGLIVLNKCDLVDQEWKELIKEEIREELADTCFADAPMAEVSALTGEGIPELIQMIQKMADRTQERDSSGIFRLPADRVFTITGFGTVVTGTLLSGKIHRGDELMIYPSCKRSRVRGLQVHDRETEEAAAGQRVAVNLMNIEKKEIDRGDVLAPPDSMECSSLLDVRLNHNRFSGRELPNRVRLHLCIGTDQILCRAVLLDRDVLKPGESCYAQLVLEEPLAVRRGDRFILRFYSPLETVGGGTVVDPAAVKRKRFRQEDLEELEKKESGSGEDALRLLVKKSGSVPLAMSEPVKAGILPEEEIREAAEVLERQGMIRSYTVNAELYFLDCQAEENLLGHIMDHLKQFHRQHPYQWGIGKAEIQTRFLKGIKPALASSMLEQWEERQVLKRRQEYISEYAFEIPKDHTYRKVKLKLQKELRRAGFDFVRYSDISFGETPRDQADDILQVCLEEGDVVKLEDNLYTLPEIAQDAVERLTPILREQGKITIVQARDVLESSRKSIKPLFEYMDSLRLTRKNGTESEREAIL